MVQGSSARFNEPHGLTADKNGNIYIADRINNLIRKITPSGTVSTFAGTGAIGATDGPALTASFNEPWDIACDTLGNFYIADTKNYKIRKIDASGNVTTLAGRQEYSGPVTVRVQPLVLEPLQE